MAVLRQPCAQKMGRFTRVLAVVDELRDQRHNRR
jgi:hypothetical protein